jgi:hypothetical protein
MAKVVSILWHRPLRFNYVQGEGIDVTDSEYDTYEWNGPLEEPIQ